MTSGPATSWGASRNGRRGVAAANLPPPEHAAFRRALLAWYRRTRRDLPWRRTRDAYAVWLSEIMLQQTRVETARPYFERFVAAFPGFAALAAAPLDEVLRLWSGLGYYRRAQNLHRAARYVVNELGGALPRTAAEWQRLPGVGRYTAGAIASIAFDERVPAVDGNVKRALARVYRIRTSLAAPGAIGRLWSIATELLPRRAVGDYNQALMELGARVCVPRNPRCGKCPVRAYCRAAQAGCQNELPRMPRRKAPTRIHAVAALICRQDHILLVQRPPDGLLGGLWGLPECELESARDGRAALAAHLRSTLGIAVAATERIATVRHVFTHRDLRLGVYRCELRAGRPRAGRWVHLTDVAQLPLATLERKVLAKLASVER